MSFSSIGLSEPIMQAIASSGYTTPTEIQSRAIPLIIDGNDVIGCAPTGTGKTAAFVMPILHRLMSAPKAKSRKRPPRCLVLTPTRELAEQIEKAVQTYGRRTPIRSAAIYGGVDIRKQFRALQRGADIVVATPGRLLDHLARHSIDLRQIEVLVLDEADRMFDMGFIKDVRRIIGTLPTERQTLLFSATMSSEVRRLARDVQKQPKLIEVGISCAPVETVTQHFYSVPQKRKMELLEHVLRHEDIDSMLIFSRTKHGADRIARRLERSGVPATAIHANRTQSQRRNALEGFRRKQYQILVATDVAARGIDVDGISHVVNYDTPTFAEDYVHRIGRTGRAEATGVAFTFVSDEERQFHKRIQRFTGMPNEAVRYPGYDCPEYALQEALEKRRAEIRSRGAFGRTPRRRPVRVGI
ncbi:MAG: DEAD/DEAH box helicase [Chitinivibrionales bacterium]|nr:DEAD/DEAH box helicase [Chitinivibrionales bacterium]